MPLAVSYPGVYVQPIVQPSPPDSGVATSLAAFVGRMAMGPVDRPVTLNSWGDCQRVFGGLSQDSSAAYQISAFFNNGGGQAIGVRLFEPAFSDRDIDGRIVNAEPGEGAVAEALAAVKAAYNPPGGAAPATPSKSEIVRAVSQAFAAAGRAGGDRAVAATLFDGAWEAASRPLADRPAEADVEAAVRSLQLGPYTFTATVSADPMSPIAGAVAELLGELHLQAAAPNVTFERMSLLAARSASEAPAGSPVGSALRALGRAVGTAPAPVAVPATVALAVPAAYRQAVPVLRAARPADAYAPTVAALDEASAVTAALGEQVGTVLTAQVALRAAAAPGAAVSDVKGKVTAFVAAHFPGDAAARALEASVEGAADVPAAAKAASGAVSALLPAAKNARVAAAAEAVDAYAAAPDGDLASAVVLAVMGGVVAAWPSEAKPLFAAKSPGAWGNRLSVAIDADGISAAVAASLGVADAADLFNVTVLYEDPSGLVQTETFSNVTLDPSRPGLYLGNVLDKESNYVDFVGGSLVVPGSGGSGSGGRDSWPISMTTYLGDQSRKSGLYALDQAPLFNMLCIPPDDGDGDTPNLVYQSAARYCVERNAMLIVDPPRAWQNAFVAGNLAGVSLADLGSFGADEGRSSAVYFPRVLAADPLRNGQIRPFPNSGYVAGLWAQTDLQTGLWKAPAGITAALNGVAGLEAVLSDVQNGLLNPVGINCLRVFPLSGSVVWGARTMRGADQLGDQYNYIPVRRMLLYLTDWTLQNTKWAVFQPNDEALWSGLRLQISTLLNGLWKRGALFGTSANQAYFVKCDASTTLQPDIDAGRVNVQIGFAPVRPAEFVVVTLQQVAGPS